MNTAIFILIAIPLLAGALAAATLRNLVHAALSLVVAFVGVAALYFYLGAEFVGLIQILVYIGAVAVLIVFTILLTRKAEEERASGLRWSGVLVSIAVFAGLLWAVLSTPLHPPHTAPAHTLTIKQIGLVLLSDYVWPLQAVGLLLTAALIGAMVLVIEEKEKR